MNKYFHSVQLDADRCCGCTNCLKRCPTEAIRVHDGKAKILSEPAPRKKGKQRQAGRYFEI